MNTQRKHVESVLNLLLKHDIKNMKSNIITNSFIIILNYKKFYLFLPRIQPWISSDFTILFINGGYIIYKLTYYILINVYHFF